MQAEANENVHFWMRVVIIAAIVIATFAFARPARAAEPLTRVWGLYGWGDNWRGTSRGVDEIAEQARTIPNVESVIVHNYWETQLTADEILMAPAETRIIVYGYSCGANAATTIAHGLDGYRDKLTILGIQPSLWCGGDNLGGNVLYGQATVGKCAQTLGLGCKRYLGNQSFNGTILNISRPELHSQADTDPDAQQDVLNAILETAAPPPPDDPQWHYFGHGHALARHGFAEMLKGAALFKRGVHEIVCHHGQC
jgi:hypothetical protein